MADCDKLFRIYLDEIRIKAKKRKALKTSRDANRQRIRDFFKASTPLPIPKFHGQGSYMMHTGISPRNEEFDVDDGIYLQGLGVDKSKWPTIDILQDWIVAATSGYTSSPPSRHTSCVRVPYQAGYHIDLPQYATVDGTPYLLVQGGEPVESDPRALYTWFGSEAGLHPTKRHIVRILKGWKDHNQINPKLASGVGLTILVCDHFVEDERLDVCFLRTVEAVREHLNCGGKICKPVSPYEDLTAQWTKEERDQLVGKLDGLIKCGQEGDEADLVTASQNWIGILGKRFPVGREQVLAASESRVVKAIGRGPLLERIASHIQRPWWPEERRYTAELECEVYLGDKDAPAETRRKLGRITSDGPPVSSGLALRFRVVTGAPQDYRVFWQVANTGKHAERARGGRGLRGEILSGEKEHWENTLWTGRHWIQAFLVRNNKQIAETRRFYVNIENPDYPEGTEWD